MNNQIIKTIFFGALLGAALFAAPFFALKVLLFFLIIGFFFRMFKGRGYRRRGWNYSGWAYADKIRQMSDQDYEEFKEKTQHGCWPEDSGKPKDTKGDVDSTNQKA